jgi:hypothetical protein
MGKPRKPRFHVLLMRNAQQYRAQERHNGSRDKGTGRPALRLA